MHRLLCRSRARLWNWRIRAHSGAQGFQISSCSNERSRRPQLYSQSSYKLRRLRERVRLDFAKSWNKNQIQLVSLLQVEINEFQSLETAEAIPEHTSHTSQRNKAGIKKKRLLVSSEKLASKDKLPRISSTHYLLLATKAKLALFLMINIFKLNNKRHCQIIVVINRNFDYWLHEQVERLFGISIGRK